MTLLVHWQYISSNLKSKTDKRQVSIGIDGNGGRFDSHNKMGERVAFMAVDDKGGGGVVTQKMTVPTNKFKWYNTDSVAVCVEEEVEESEKSDNKSLDC